jgi:hypothetical protein
MDDDQLIADIDGIDRTEGVGSIGQSDLEYSRRLIPDLPVSPDVVT